MSLQVLFKRKKGPEVEEKQQAFNILRKFRLLLAFSIKYKKEKLSILTFQFYFPSARSALKIIKLFITHCCEDDDDDEIKLR